MNAENAIPDRQINIVPDTLVKTVADLPVSVAIKLAPYADNAIGYFDKILNILDQVKAMADGFGVLEAVKTIQETASTIKKSAQSTAALAKDANLSAVEKVMAVCINYSKYIKSALTAADAVNSQFLHKTANIWIYELGQVSRAAETNVVAAQQIVETELELLNMKYNPTTTTATSISTSTSTTTTSIKTTTPSTTTTSTTAQPRTIEIKQEIRKQKIEKISEQPKINKPFKFRLFPSKKNFGNRRKVNKNIKITRTEKPTAAFTETNTQKIPSSVEKTTIKSPLSIIADKREKPQLFQNFPRVNKIGENNNDKSISEKDINEKSIVSVLQQVFNPKMKSEKQKPVPAIENLSNQKLNFKSLLEQSQKTNSERTKTGEQENFQVSCSISCTAVVCVQKCTVCNQENCTTKSIQ